MNVELRTKYIGLSLRNPLIVAANPLTNELTNIQRFEQAGAAAVVVGSLFQEQIEHESWELDRRHGSPARPYDESLNYFPQIAEYNTGPDGFLRHVAAAKKIASIPIIASLNGTHSGAWTRFARLIQEAGADALELNIYRLATDPTRSAADVESRELELVAEVRSSISIPLAVKLSPSFSSLPNFVSRLTEMGVDGVVLFNRFMQPDFDLETMELTSRLVLSRREESRLPLRWISIMRGQTPISLAATGGIHTAEDALKMLLVGADAVMVASVLLENGPECLSKLLKELQDLMEEKGYKSLDLIRGLASQRGCPDPTAYERAQYIKTVTGFALPPYEESDRPVEFAVHGGGSATSEQSGNSPSPNLPR